MPRCPNCSYILVLLEKRAKYKCAKCGKLFTQKEIDNKEFREYNKKQRESGKEEFEKQLRLRLRGKPKKHKISAEEKQKKLQEYRLKNADKIKEYSTSYYQNNRDRILTYKKEWRKIARERNNQTRRIYRQNHSNIIKTWLRIDYWRQRQKELVLESFY